MKKLLYFAFFYILVIVEGLLACLVLFFIFSGLFIKKLYKFFVPKKAQEVVENIIDDASNFLGVEAEPHVEAKNFAEHDQQNKHPNPEITS